MSGFTSNVSQHLSCLRFRDLPLHPPLQEKKKKKEVLKVDSYFSYFFRSQLRQFQDSSPAN